MAPSLLGALTALGLLASASAADIPDLTRSFADLNCLKCHSSDEKRGGLDLDHLSRNLDDPAIEEEWIYLYDRVRRSEMPPKSEPKLDPGKRAEFLALLEEPLRQRDATRKSQSGRVPLRRLNRVEYENTVHDLLAIDTPLADLLPQDGGANGFDNVAEALRLSPAQIEAYLAAGNKALDAAIQLGSPPESSKRRFHYLDRPNIKSLLARPKAAAPDKYRPDLYIGLPDAFVMLGNDSRGVTAIRETQAPITGQYRIRLSAYAWRGSAQRPVTVKVMASRYTSKRQAAAFAVLTDKPDEFETTARLEKGEYLQIDSSGCANALAGSRSDGPGLALQWIEMEGPLAFRWPPQSLAKVFDDTPVRRLEKPRDDRFFDFAPRNREAEVRQVVSSFALRAFRRPVTEPESSSYVRLAEQALKDGLGFEKAVRRACLAILTSPEFLFLRESPGRLDDYALAARLSYFLWSTMPDDELLQLAGAGRLHDPDILRSQTERLLNSPRAAAFSHDFCGQWLNLRGIDATTPDKSLYPEFDALLQQAMVYETELYFGELVRSDLGVSWLIDSDFSMLNHRLAEHYHIPGVVGDEFQRVSLPKEAHRGGVLTHASLLKVTANGTTTSPVLRGAWVMERMLGRPSKPPPANIGSIEPDTRGATTIREQLDKHRHEASCAACHQYIDPPGFALESYDVIGGWREWYRSQGEGARVVDPITGKRLEYGQGPRVDTHGELADGQKFADLEELKKLLLDQQEEIARNLANQLVTYATGAGVSFADRPAVDEILRQAKSKSYGIRTLVHEIVQSPLFLSK